VRRADPASGLSSFAGSWGTWHKPACCDDPLHVPPEWLQIEPILQAAFSLMTAGGNRSLTSWNPDALRLAFDALLDNDAFLDDALLDDALLDSDAPDVEEVLTAIAMSLRLFAEMLVDTGRWSGSEGQLEECLAILDDVLDEPGLSFSFDDVSETEQLAALGELAVIRRMEALLTWLGDSKPVTATGALKLAVIPAAAKAIGMSVAVRQRNVGSSQQTSLPIPHLHLVTADEQPPSLVDVTSMWEVPELATAWHSMRMTDLIELGRTVARPGDRVDVWRVGPLTDRVSLRQQAVVHHLMVDFQQAEAWGSAGGILQAIQFAALYAAANSLPVNDDDLIELGRRVGPPVWEESLPSFVDRILQRCRRDGYLILTGQGDQMPAGVKPAVACALTAIDLAQSQLG
jgi:hypothetical protein